MEQTTTEAAEVKTEEPEVKQEPVVADGWFC